MDGVCLIDISIGEQWRMFPHVMSLSPGAGWSSVLMDMKMWVVFLVILFIGWMMANEFLGFKGWLGDEVFP